MGKLYQRYVSFLFLKNFFVIFVALEIFYVGVDLLSNIKSLPTSANLQLLYVYFNAQVAVNYTLPLGLVFAMIVSKISMIRSNELISLYTSGISRSQVIYPLFLASLFLTFVLIGLNFTSFSYAVNYKSNLLKYNRIEANSAKLFVKYNDKYVYIDELHPLKKQAQGIKIFKIKEDSLISITSIKKAYFHDNAWHSNEANVTFIPKVKKLGGEGLKEKHIKNQTFLRGFKPKTMDTMHEGKSTLSIIDAYDALRFLSTQNSNINGVKSTLFTLLFLPLFSPLIVIILFYYLPPIGRFFNLALLSFLLVFVSLSVWGILFVISKFALNGVILPEIGIILPIILMGFYALRLFYKNR